MSRAIRSVSVEKGYDMADFALCAFGGAGPLHAAEVAVECGLPRILIPREPGTLCARGMLLTDLSSDYVRSYFADATAENWRHVLSLFDAMEADGEAWLDKEEVPVAQRRFKRVLDARYRGQNFEVKVDCDGIGADDLAQLEERFHAAHTREYGYDIRHRAIQLVSARLQAIGEVQKAPQAELAGGESLDGARAGSRNVYYDARNGWLDTPIYRRGDLPAGVTFEGPAIINEMSATSLILPGQSVQTDRWGNLIVETHA